MFRHPFVSITAPTPALRTTRRLAAVLVLCAAGSLALASTCGAVNSTQQFSFSTSTGPSSSPATVSAQIGDGVAIFVTLGLVENLSVKAFNTPAGIGLLITGSSPLVIRSVLPGTLTPLPGDPQYGSKLSFAFPQTLQQPAPGAISTFTDMKVTLPLQYAASGAQPVPLVATTGCASGGWDAKYVAVYTDASQQTTTSRQTCTQADVGPSSLAFRSFFGDVSADAGAPFAVVTAEIYLPKELTLNLKSFPTCATATILAGEASCPASPDSDTDGVPNGTDACPGVAGLTATGCPPGTADADKDGVINTSDHCPALAGPPPSGCPASALRASLRLSSSTLRVSTTGAVQVTVGCPAQAPSVCRGTLILKTRPGRSTIAQARYRVGPAKTAKVRMNLSYGAAHTVLQRRRKLSATLQLRDGTGRQIGKRSLVLSRGR